MLRKNSVFKAPDRRGPYARNCGVAIEQVELNILCRVRFAAQDKGVQ